MKGLGQGHVCSTGQERWYEVHVGNNRWARCSSATCHSDGTLTYTLYDGRSGVAVRDEWATTYSAPAKQP